MYSIQYLEVDRWQVLDEDHHAVFVGNKRQVEDWLDREENLRRRSSPKLSVQSAVRSLHQMIHRLAGRLARHTKPRGGHTALRSHATKR